MRWVGPVEYSQYNLLFLSTACFSNTHTQRTWTSNLGKQNSSFSLLGPRGSRFWFWFWFLRRLEQRSVLGWEGLRDQAVSFLGPCTLLHTLPPCRCHWRGSLMPPPSLEVLKVESDQRRPTDVSRTQKALYCTRGWNYTCESEAPVCIWPKKWSSCLTQTDSPGKWGVGGGRAPVRNCARIPRGGKDRVKGWRNGRRDIWKDGWKEERHHGIQCLLDICFNHELNHIFLYIFVQNVL